MSFMRGAIRDVLRPTVKGWAGVSIRYHAVVNGLVYSTTPSGDTLKATLDGASGEVETNSGLTVPFHVGIFKIDRLDLPIMPQRLDKIEWIDPEDSTRVEWFMVLSDNATDSVGPQGNFRDTWRINAKWIPDEVSTHPVIGNNGTDVIGNADGDLYAGAGN